MIYRFPEYYNQFSCIANQCEATCCAGWQIVVDEEALRRYRNISGTFSQRIKEGVDFKEGVFCQKEGKRCAFLNEENLCDMYIALGEESFCDTCRRYPRHIEEFENVREVTLSASCPEAARILLSQKKPVCFYEEEIEEEIEEFDDFDPMLYEKLLEAREEMLLFLQNRRWTIQERAAGIWSFVEEFQEEMDEGILFADESLYQKLIPRQPETSYEEAKALFALLSHLELLEDTWEETRIQAERILYQSGEEEYKKLKQSFLKWKADHMPDWDVMLEQLLVYFVYTYFCGAVYDEYVASKVKMSVCSVFYIEELAMAQWKINKQALTFDELVRIVYRYSRELEHSDNNLRTMDQMMEEI